MVVFLFSMCARPQPLTNDLKEVDHMSSISSQDSLAIVDHEKAIEQSDSNLEKAKLYLKIGRIQFKNGLKPEARESARISLSLDSTYLESHRLIGDLYMSSYEECANKKSRVEDRAVFIAAYYEYQKAGYTAGMDIARAQFPNVEEIFSEGFEEDTKITIGCWIQTTVTF